MQLDQQDPAPLITTARQLIDQHAKLRASKQAEATRLLEEANAHTRAIDRLQAALTILTDNPDQLPPEPPF